MRAPLACLLLTATDGKEWDVHYAPLNVWPMPTGVTLPSPALGPHVVKVAAPNVSASCGDAIESLAGEALSLVTVYRGPAETYEEEPYREARDAACNPSARCASDSDCVGDATCYVRSDVRWSSTVACAPSTAFSIGCGCCTPSRLPSISTLIVTCDDSRGNDDDDESYALNISSRAIHLAARAPRGAAHALSTLAQLLRYDTTLKAHVTDVVPLAITDAPLFSWRGLMVDTSRHFLPVADLLALVDAMAAAKLNVFHWHIVDSPSFPWESQRYPELSREGSWSQSIATIYTAADVRAVVARAASRFVQVVLEIDTPAHTLAIARSHPEMVPDGCWEWMARSQYKVDVDSDDTMALDPTNDAARRMVRMLLAEAAELSGAASTHVHLGGDEVKYGCWAASASIRETVTRRYGNTSDAAYARLQAEWTANVSAAAVVAAGKVPVVWQPTTKGPGDPAWDEALPANTVYMVWLNAESAANYAKANRDVVYTTPFYVAGMGTDGWLSVYNAPLLPSKPPLEPSAAAHILGGEVCAWGESLSSGNLAMRTFTIGAAAAENFWRAHEEGHGVGEASGLGLGTRYNRFLCHLRRFGLEVPPIMPSYCEAGAGMG